MWIWKYDITCGKCTINKTSQSNIYLMFQPTLNLYGVDRAITDFIGHFW